MPSLFRMVSNAVIEFVAPDSGTTHNRYEALDTNSRRLPSDQLLSRTSENFASNGVTYSHAVISSKRTRNQPSTDAFPNSDSSSRAAQNSPSLSPNAKSFTPTFGSVSTPTSSHIVSTSTANAPLQDPSPSSTASTSTLPDSSPAASSKSKEIALQKKIDQLVAKETAAAKHEDSLRKTNKDAKNEIDRLKKLTARLESANQEFTSRTKSMEKVQLELSSRLEHSQAHSRRLETHLSDVEALKALSDRSLAEIRQFVTINDSGDIAQLVQKVDDFNEAVDELAYRLSELMSDPSTDPGAAGILATLASIPLGAGSVVADVVDLQVIREIRKDELFIQTFKVLLHRLLNDGLWQQFHFFGNTSACLAVVHEAMRETEPQAVHARWRSLGYATLNRVADINFDQNVQRATDDIWRSLEPLCLAFLDLLTLPSASNSNKNHLKELSSLLADAFRLHKTLQQDYLSADFSILYPSPGTPFDPRQMINAMEETKERNKGKGRKSTATVAGVVGVGLQKSTMQTKGNGERVEQTEVITKPAALTSEWLAKRA